MRCNTDGNRRVRTRMLGGVGGAEPRGSPLSRLGHESRSASFGIRHHDCPPTMLGADPFGPRLQTIAPGEQTPPVIPGSGPLPHLRSESSHKHPASKSAGFRRKLMPERPRLASAYPQGADSRGSNFRCSMYSGRRTERYFQYLGRLGPRFPPELHLSPFRPKMR